MPVRPPLTTADLDYDLPPGLVAQHPAAQRGASRLLVLQAGEPEPLALGRFDELLLGQLRDGDLVVANDSRVLHARVPVRRPTGGAGELLLLAPTDDQSGLDSAHSRWSALARPARRLRPGLELATMHGDATITCVERLDQQAWVVELPSPLGDVPAWLLAHGELPLPPYIAERGQDPERYQTVHARVDGSVAAPTAGLHFDEAMWDAVRSRARVEHVTLHVGAGTFLPVADGSLAAHAMHAERYEVPARTHEAVLATRAAGGRVVAVGTTATRVLEHVYGNADPAAALRGGTALFIVPGHEWSCVDAMLTNLHLPRSTLVALVMAFHGVEQTRAAYAAAIDARLRFYSFGDAMFMHGPPLGPHRR